MRPSRAQGPSTGSPAAGSPENRLQAARESVGRLLENVIASIEQAHDHHRAELAGVEADVRALQRHLAEFAATEAAQVWQQHELPAGTAAAREEMTRTFPQVQEPGGNVTARVRPKPFPATLLVAAEPRGHVEVVAGLGRFFPPHTVHAEDCGIVVDGNRCRLTSQGHYHLRTVAVSLEPFLDTGSPAHDALMKLPKSPTDKAIKTFQGVMREISGLPEQRDTRASLPVKRGTGRP